MPPKRSSLTSGGKRGKPPAWLRDTKSGDAIWVKAPAPELWARGTAVRFEGGKLLLKMADGTEVATAVDADMHPANEGEANDMCSLGHINEPSILSALETRMAAQDGKAIREEMFTYMASVIIATEARTSVAFEQHGADSDEGSAAHTASSTAQLRDG